MDRAVAVASLLIHILFLGLRLLLVVLDPHVLLLGKTRQPGEGDVLNFVDDNDDDHDDNDDGDGDNDDDDGDNDGDGRQPGEGDLLHLLHFWRRWVEAGESVQQVGISENQTKDRRCSLVFFKTLTLMFKTNSILMRIMDNNACWKDAR